MLVFSSHLSCVCLCMCVHVHAIACVWRSEDKWQELIPSVYCIELPDLTTEPSPSWAILLTLCCLFFFFFWYLCSRGLVKSHRILHFLIFQDKRAMGDCGGWVTTNRYISMISLCSFKTVKEMDVCHCPVVFLMWGPRLILGSLWLRSLSRRHTRPSHQRFLRSWAWPE